MKQPHFTERQLDLIGESVLGSICELRKAKDSLINIHSVRVGIQSAMDELNEILTILAETSHE